MSRFEQLMAGELLEQPLIMGILNVTPDSFSDGGRFNQLDAARKQVEKMLADGADLIDVGGESTRPGAVPVALQEELDRVLPVIEMLKREFEAIVSIDTYKTGVMKEAIGLGVDLINDVNALQSNGALALVAKHQVPVCLMHKKGSSQTMQQEACYEDVVKEVVEFLTLRAEACQQAGLGKNKILIDPGFGFAKTLPQNVLLFESLEQLVLLEYPVLVGVSRKRMIAELMRLPTDGATEQRLLGSVVAAVMATLKGAKVIRVHDVLETRQGIETALALV